MIQLDLTYHIAPETEETVHTRHCCVVHGCKYGEYRCEVFLGNAKQSGPCEYCSMDYQDTGNQTYLFVSTQEIEARRNMSLEEQKLFWDYHEEKDHLNNCCVVHGCMYGDPDCEIWSGHVEQNMKCKDAESRERKVNDVHVNNCCVVHGCKYNDYDCKVWLGYVEQAQRCEKCEENQSLFVSEHEISYRRGDV